MQRYYCPVWSEGDIFFLSEEESAHCIRVMRHTASDHIAILDGKGHLIEAEIVVSNVKKTGLKFIQILEKEETPNMLHIAISPTKSNDRMELFLEKSCEIGIGKITPIQCLRTERKNINIERWQKLIIAASKQSKSLWFATINEMEKLEHFLTKNESADRFITSLHTQDKWTSVSIQNESIVLIGPEGDFDDQELKKAIEVGYKPISLGDSILRVETAGIVACTQWNFISG